MPAGWVHQSHDLIVFGRTYAHVHRSKDAASQKMPGHDRIYTAGEKEYLTSLEREKSGIPLNKSLQKELAQLRDECDLKSYQFPF